jgi:hypothetical protein
MSPAERTGMPEPLSRVLEPTGAPFAERRTNNGTGRPFGPAGSYLHLSQSRQVYGFMAASPDRYRLATPTRPFLAGL